MFICPYLRLKKENVLTADDNGLTLIHAEVENRDRNNSDANRFDITHKYERNRVFYHFQRPGCSISVKNPVSGFLSITVSATSHLPAAAAVSPVNSIALVVFPPPVCAHARKSQ